MFCKNQDVSGGVSLTRFLLFWTSLLVTTYSAVGENVNLGSSIRIPCYNEAFASMHETLFVELEFSSLTVSPYSFNKIGSYKPSDKAASQISAQYSNRLNFFDSGEVEISNLMLSDEGVYRCVSRVFNANPPDSDMTQIVVLVPPKVEVTKIDDPLVAGGSIMNAAKCMANGGKPAATVKWNTNRNMDFTQTFDNTSSGQLTTSSSILRVQPTKFYNKQTFFCEIAHPAFPQTNVTYILLNVNYAAETPVITVHNDQKTLTCSSDGNPTPTITWQLPPGAPTTVYQGPTVSMVQPEDSSHYNDTYVCTATNGIGSDAQRSISTGEAITVVEFTKQGNVGVIVGAVIGAIVLIAIIVGLVYFFIIRKRRNKDEGPYKPRSSARNYQTEGHTPSRPVIQHANNSLNKNRPPSPSGPPPDDKNDDDKGGHSDFSESDGSQHDVDLGIDPSTALVQPPAYNDQPSAGITSRSSVNFRPYWKPSLVEAQRKRPSTSPGSRRSRQMQKADSPTPAPRQPVRYDEPPGPDYGDNVEPYDNHDDYDPRYDDEAPYPTQQPQYVGYPSQRQQGPRHNENLPPYEPKYTEIDHSSYRKGNPVRNDPYDEPVEYAQIRHGYSHVV